MADDKIRIDLTDVNTPEVDARLEHERRMRAAAEHYGQRAHDGSYAGSPGAVPGHEYGRVAMIGQGGVGMTGSAHSGRGSIFYSSVLYTALAGLIAATGGWGTGEVFSDWDDRQDWAEVWIDALDQQGISQIEFMNLSEQEQERIVSQFESKIHLETIVHSSLWFAMIGAFLGLGLGCVESVVGRAWNSAFVSGAAGLGIGLVGGAISGAVAQQLYSQLLSVGISSEDGGRSMGMQILARALGFGVAGMLVGVSQGIHSRSSRKTRNGLLGGLVGGLVGGFLFDPIGIAFDGGGASRFVALLLVGGLMGAFIGVVENLLKDAWLRVTAGPLTGKQFVIYRNPTTFGSSPKADIYLFKDPAVEPMHALLHMASQGYELEALPSMSGTFVNGQRISRQKLRRGDLIQIGQYAFSYDEKAKQVVNAPARI